MLCLPLGSAYSAYDANARSTMEILFVLQVMLGRFSACVGVNVRLLMIIPFRLLPVWD